MKYEALVEVTIRDKRSLKSLPSVRIPVQFDPPEDPRQMLTKVALEKALEHAQIAEEFMWLQP